jgi:hypothetical protein
MRTPKFSRLPKIFKALAGTVAKNVHGKARRAGNAPPSNIGGLGKLFWQSV